MPSSIVFPVARQDLPLFFPMSLFRTPPIFFIVRTFPYSTLPTIHDSIANTDVAHEHVKTEVMGKQVTLTKLRLAMKRRRHPYDACTWFLHHTPLLLPASATRFVSISYATSLLHLGTACILTGYTNAPISSPSPASQKCYAIHSLSQFTLHICHLVQLKALLAR